MKKITLRLNWAEIMVLNDMVGLYLDQDGPMSGMHWDPPLDPKDPPIGVETLFSLRRAIQDQTGPMLIKKKIAVGRDWWRHDRSEDVVKLQKKKRA